MARHILRIEEGDTKRMLHDISVALDPFKDKPNESEEFVVEGTLEDPKILIRYPGKKKKRRPLKNPKRKGAVLWEALYDFLVIVIKDGSEVPIKEFSYRKIVADIRENKDDERFWECLDTVYKKNEIPARIPKLDGIDCEALLMVMKWIWLQEDINYKYNWKDIDSPTRYTTVRGIRALGRKKSRAMFLLNRHHGHEFDHKESYTATFG